MVYVSECPPDSAGTVLSALAESVVSPKIVPWEMADASVRDGNCVFAKYFEVCFCLFLFVSFFFFYLVVTSYFPYSSRQCSLLLRILFLHLVVYFLIVPR